MNFTRSDVYDMTWDEALWHFEWLKSQRAQEARDLRSAQRRQKR